MLLDLPSVPLPDWVAGVACSGRSPGRACSPACTTACAWPPSSSASGRPTRWPTPSGCSTSVPPALYEVGTALVVAVTVFPQLADSARRVRAAQALRGGADGRVGRLRRFLVPVLEDALERSLALAAGMDTRGYGRAGTATRGRAPAHRCAPPRAPCAASGWAPTPCSTPRPRAGWPRRCWSLGVVVAVVGLVSAGRRVQRSRYRPDPWRLGEVARRRCPAWRSAALVWWIGRARRRWWPTPASSRCPTSACAALGRRRCSACCPRVAAPPPRHAVAPALAVGA